MNIKELKKLAAACRKAGIKSFKSPEFEFTLSDEEPVKFKGSKQKQYHQDDGHVEMPEELTPEQLLFYSVNATPEETEST